MTSCQAQSGTCITQPAPNGTGCDDGNPCTQDDRCGEGLCEGTPGDCPCLTDDDCATLQSESYDLCQGPLHCDAHGLCTPDVTLAISCEEDVNPFDCVEVSCNPGTGLCATAYKQDGAECQAEGLCGPVGSCASGECIADGLSCDDANPCTDDQCDGAIGCVHTPLSSLACDDGDACTEGDSCVAGTCESGTALVCDDDNPCTQDKCVSSAGGCTTAPLEDGLACQPEDLCVGAGFCDGGQCLGGSLVECTQSSPCMVAQCLPDQGCIEEPLSEGTPCDDSDPCTQEGVCQAGTCQTVPKGCNDNNPCTVDSCQGGTCSHLQLDDGTLCDTLNPCETMGTCIGGTCQGALEVTCEPGLCDVKSCDPATGACVLSHVVSDGVSCGAESACDVAGECQEGSCIGATVLTCDDADACTIDSCDPEFGLGKHSPALCPPSPEVPCVEPVCSPSAGCELDESGPCTAESLLWHSTFDCDDTTTWMWMTDDASPEFTLTDESPSTGPLDGGCHAQIAVPPESAASDLPWTATIASQPLMLPGEHSGSLGVRFWQNWEWEGSGLYEAGERRLQLLDSDMQVLESHPLPQADVSWGTWVSTELALDVDPTITGPLHLAFAFTSKPTDDALGCVWTVDHVVVYVNDAPAND